VARRIANARMYAVSPEVEAAWRRCPRARRGRRAGLALEYEPYPAPQPLEALWARPDLERRADVRLPIALKLAPVVPIAAPIPRRGVAAGQARYRTDLIVRADSPFRRSRTASAARAGWTVAHSPLGVQRLPPHLLAYRRPDRPALYREMVGELITARNVLEQRARGAHRRGAPRCVLAPLDARHGRS